VLAGGIVVSLLGWSWIGFGGDRPRDETALMRAAVDEKGGVITCG
jgi:hypothetical protein